MFLAKRLMASEQTPLVQYSASLDGASDYFFSNNSGVPSTYTLSAFVKFSGATSIRGIMGWSNSSGQNAESNIIARNSDNQLVWIGIGGNENTGLYISDTNWHHVHVTRASTQISITLDAGTPYAVSNDSLPGTPTERYLTFGRLGEYDGFYFPGNIAHCWYVDGASYGVSTFASSGIPKLPSVIDAAISSYGSNGGALLFGNSSSLSDVSYGSGAFTTGGAPTQSTAFPT